MKIRNRTLQTLTFICHGEADSVYRIDIPPMKDKDIDNDYYEIIVG